jgi:hypothetical protein
VTTTSHREDVREFVRVVTAAVGLAFVTSLLAGSDALAYLFCLYTNQKWTHR